jgi:hypothetical protein
MKPRLRKTVDIALGTGCGAVVAIFAFAILDRYFKATMPDCAPGQIDGQCGLATFLQVIYSLAGALLAWPIAAVLFARYLLRRSARAEALIEKSTVAEE